MWELLKCIGRCAAQSGRQVYLVGGAVRDFLLGLAPVDLDLAAAGNIYPLARQVAEKLQGRLFTLDQERQMLRVVLPDRRHLDFSSFRGLTIEEDLRARDFTVNALALPLHLELAHENNIFQHLLDPTGGYRDITLGLLRATGPYAVKADYLRALRGIRLAAQLGFVIVPETAVLLKQGCRHLGTVAGERIWQELTAFFSLPAVYAWVEYADRELNLWQALLPGRARMATTQQNYYHTENVWRHSLRTFYCLEVILRELPASLLAGQQALAVLQQCLAGGRTRLPLLKLAALLHDVGKPDTAVTLSSGRISFRGHPQAGLPYVRAMAEQCKMSRAEQQYLSTLVLLHMQPLHFYTKGDYADLSLYRLFVSLGDYTPDLLLLSLADLTATYTAGERLSELTPYRQLIFDLLQQHFAQPNKFKPQPLLSGRDLLALGVKQGPLVGKLLQQLTEAQVAGEIKTVDQAKSWVKGNLSSCREPID
ncbi:HD domain-containing protein [Desulforamulus hydrothermalis]|uniref:Polynucleotide adenylyltransferase/metal dependent phosphohydrolase n=1 Tax=Desulforamulus hydrothermalis Lam5 = DSM 18033 TaxID=1121428 RepID=K8DZT9_9FIRM|nr:HD domain-containing protein [Desulforamulus hydrothermalis]CCO08674.1 Polynucleotide adenylyltransferase/metal dependent phosphohydrolase [Desulforamulus hydrothermalis Lam5 = DSM 18033]SHH38818.1 poly(A) polymerase [Desulforamulus hydrothermalis Lam5 = DSM 18033]